MFNYFCLVFRCSALNMTIKGIVHFEINFWYVLAYLKAIQDVGVFDFDIFRSKRSCLSVI